MVMELDRWVDFMLEVSRHKGFCFLFEELIYPASKWKNVQLYIYSDGEESIYIIYKDELISDIRLNIREISSIWLNWFARHIEAITNIILYPDVDFGVKKAPAILELV